MGRSHLPHLSRMALTSWACLQGDSQGSHSWEWDFVGPVAERTEAGPGNILESHKTVFTFHPPAERVHQEGYPTKRVTTFSFCHTVCLRGNRRCQNQKWSGVQG